MLLYHKSRPVQNNFVRLRIFQTEYLEEGQTEAAFSAAAVGSAFRFAAPGSGFLAPSFKKFDIFTPGSGIFPCQTPGVLSFWAESGRNTEVFWGKRLTFGG